MSIIGEQLRFVSLAEAAERAGRSQRQVQRWAEEQYGAVRKRRQGRVVEYCLDDVLEVVGASPVQRKLTRLQDQVAQGKTEREALEDQVRHWKKKLNDFQARAKENYQERDAQITSLEIRNASLQAENSQLRLSQGTGPTTVAGSLAQPVQRDWSAVGLTQAPPWADYLPSPERSHQDQLAQVRQRLEEVQQFNQRWQTHCAKLEGENAHLRDVVAEWEAALTEERSYSAYVDECARELRVLVSDLLKLVPWTERHPYAERLRAIIARPVPGEPGGSS